MINKYNYNTFGKGNSLSLQGNQGTKTELQLAKALSSANGSGEALIPQWLETVITNTVQRLVPEINMIQPDQIEGKLYEYNKLTALGSVGGAMGENGTTATKSSTYSRENVTAKIIRRKGSVTNFLQDTSKRAYDSMAVEMENVLRAHTYDLVMGIMYGNATANAYEFDGWNKSITTNRTSGISAGATTIPTSLKVWDDMIDASNRAGGARHRRFFVMTPEMLSLHSRLLTNVRINQPVSGNDADVEIGGGWRLKAYRDIPIMESTLMGGVGAATMGTVTAGSASASGGGLSDGAHYGRVVAVTQFGESIPSAEFTITLSGGGSAQKFTISWTAITGAYQYKIYLGTSTGVANTTLKREISAFSYDSEGTFGAAVTSFEVTTLTAGSEVTGRTSEIPMLAVGGVNGESMALIDCDLHQGLGKFIYTHSAGNRVDGLVGIKPLAETDDFVPFLVKTYGAIVPSYEATSVFSRGWRVA